MKSSKMLGLSLILSAAIACGGASGGNNRGDENGNGKFNYPNPDVNALSDMRNDCLENYSILLASNLSNKGIYTGNGWTPLSAVSSEASASMKRSSRFFFADETLPEGFPLEKCDIYGELFKLPDSILDEGKSVVGIFELDHSFPSFNMPASPSEIPIPLVPASANPESALKITFGKMLERGDGDSEFVKSAEQIWQLDEIKCEKSFVVSPEWSSEISTLPFCREINKEQECLYYKVGFSADNCKFKILDKTFRTPSGKEFRANLGGHFELTRQGYNLTFSNIELL